MTKWPQACARALRNVAVVSCCCAEQLLLKALANKGVWTANVPVELHRKLHSSCLGLWGIVDSQIV